MLALLQGLDETFIWNLYQFTHMGNNPVFDWLFLMITKLGDLGFIWILIAVVLLITKKYRFLGVLVIVAIAITTVEVEVLKHLVARPRPFTILPIDPVLVSEKPMVSFPSGHTAASFAGAVVLAFGLPRFRKYFVILAVLIAVSRLYLAVHFFTDVVSGAFIGALTAVVVLYVYVRIKGKKPKFQ